MITTLKVLPGIQSPPGLTEAITGPEAPLVLVPLLLVLEPELPAVPVLPLEAELLLDDADAAVAPVLVELAVDVEPELPRDVVPEPLVFEPVDVEVDAPELPSEPPALPAPALELLEVRSGAAAKQPVAPKNTTSASANLEPIGSPRAAGVARRCRGGPV